jgi:hypothetical protein
MLAGGRNTNGASGLLGTLAKDTTVWTRRLRADVGKLADAARFARLRYKYRDFTMVTRRGFVTNLLVAAGQAKVRGCIVECGVWRGGMMAGMAEVLGPERHYVLCDSFEGLPKAEAIDGPRALAWQANPEGSTYYDNCRAEASFAEQAMRMASVPDYELVRGWFDQTLPSLVLPEPIAILRIDADWYQSVRSCLVNLVPKLAPGGIVIMDDYFTWDGCAKAVHEFLAETQSTARVTTPYEGLCVLQGLA